MACVFDRADNRHESVLDQYKTQESRAHNRIVRLSVVRLTEANIPLILLRQKPDHARVHALNRGLLLTDVRLYGADCCMT